MLHNYTKIAFRHLLRQRVFSLINLLGLSIGLAAVLLITLLLRYEMSYDQFHRHKDQIYRVVVDRHYTDGTVRQYATSPPPLAPALKKDFPQVRHATRVFSPQWIRQRSTVRNPATEKSFYEERFFFADSSVLQIFTLPLLKGHPLTALHQPNSVVLTRQMANKYFGTEEVMGKFLLYEDSLLLQVTGLLADQPHPSHLKMDFIASLSSLEKDFGEQLRLWGWDLTYTYLLMPAGEPAAQQLTRQLPAFFQREVPQLATSMGYTYHASLQPLTAIHLHSNRPWEMVPGGNVLYLYILSAAALLILLVAIINFIHLSTVRNTDRVKEIGIRQVLGARRRQLMGQFLVEALCSSSLSLVLACTWVQLALPAFRTLTGQALPSSWLAHPWMLACLAGISLLLALFSSAHSAFSLSKLRPSTALKGNRTVESARFRQGWMVFQLAASIFLIGSTLAIYQQIKYFRSKDLGFTRAQTVLLPMSEVGPEVEILKRALLQYPHIRGVSAASGMPAGMVERMRVRVDNQATPQPVHMLWVDFDFIRTLGLHLIAGRDFSHRFATDSSQAYIVNEAAARLWGGLKLTGKPMEWPSRDGVRKGTVIGIVKDFHYASLAQSVEPLVLTIRPSYRWLAIRIQTNQLPEALAAIEKEYKAFAPAQPFEYRFLDEEFARLYQGEERLQQGVGIVAFLSLFIACLGLLASTLYTVEKRTKEIGIRKVLGASEWNIVALLSKAYLKWVLLAFVLATPLCWWAVWQWLAGFAYHTQVEWWVFALSGILVLTIALLTVGHQAMKAALANPVRSLRTE